MPYVHDQQRFEIIQLVHRGIFVDCYQYLGKAFIQEFFFLYLASLQDSFPYIRKFVRNTICEKFNTWVQIPRTSSISKGVLIYSDLIQQCQSLYFQLITTLPAKIGKLTSTQLQYELSTLVSLSTHSLLGKSKLQEILVWNDPLVLGKLISVLFAVNIPQALKQQLIEKRIYLPFQGKVERKLEVPYYAVPLQYAESDAVRQLLQQFASSSFRYTSNLDSIQNQSFQKVQNCEDIILHTLVERFEKWKKRIFYAIQYADRHGKTGNSFASSDIECADTFVREEVMKESFQKYCYQDIQWFLSALNYFRFASFGYIDDFIKFSKEEKLRIKEEEQYCAFCNKGKEGTGGKALLRCSQCKSVFYCSKQHQQSHWPVHKIGCKKQSVTLSPQKEESKIEVEQAKEESEEFHIFQHCVFGGGNISLNSCSSQRRRVEIIELCNDLMDHYLCIYENGYLSFLWSEYQLVIGLVLELLADIFSTMNFEQYKRAITPV
jgi:hypothetical protein